MGFWSSAALGCWEGKYGGTWIFRWTVLLELVGGEGRGAAFLVGFGARSVVGEAGYLLDRGVGD